jgi:sporulation protein YlmC with PRC-barrel domain
MSKREVHVELLLGKRVFALNGKSIGRIEEIRAEVETRNSCFVTEFMVGTYALFERLSALTIGRAVLQALGARRKQGWRIPWNQLDLSDWQRPKLLCKVEELPLIKLDQ